MKSEQPTGRSPWNLWFYLTPEERRLVLGIIAIALLGLTARYVHLKNQQPDHVPTPESHSR